VVSETAPRRADARRVKERVLGRAIDVLRGEPDASMAIVAAGVGVHRATLYRHFPTRDALIGCLTERATAEGRHIVAEIAADPAELRQLRKLCTAMTEFGDKYQFLIGTAPVLNTGADPIGLAALMSQWQEAGVLRGELTPSWLAASFASLAIALHADSGPLSASVEFGCRAELLFETFAFGASATDRLPTASAARSR